MLGPDAAGDLIVLAAHLQTMRHAGDDALRVLGRLLALAGTDGLPLDLVRVRVEVCGGRLESACAFLAPHVARAIEQARQRNEETPT